MPTAIFETKAQADKYKRYLRQQKKGNVTIHRSNKEEYIPDNEVVYTSCAPNRFKSRKVKI